MRRGLLGVVAGMAFVLAAGTAITMTERKLPWTGNDPLSKSSYHAEPDTGCADWESMMIGSIQTAASDLDCLNKCLVVDGAKFANYQSDQCDAYNGAYAGACFCFKGCKKVSNTCWDLTSTGRGITTTIAEPVAAGASSVNLPSQGEMSVGDKVTFSGGGHSETHTIVGFASILLDSPLMYAYPAGSKITSGDSAESEANAGSAGSAGSAGGRGMEPKPTTTSTTYGLEATDTTYTTVTQVSTVIMLIGETTT